MPRDFLLLLGGRFFANLAMQMQAVAVGWYLYDLTGDPLVLAYAGLAVFVPVVLLTLPGGDLADRADRRLILGAMHFVQAACGVAFVFLILEKAGALPFYAVLAVSGAARALSGPAVQSFPPFLVPRERLANAMAWSSSAGQTALVIGPALGGAIYLLGPAAVFGANGVFSLCVAASMLAIRTRSVRPRQAGGALARVASGIRYLRAHPAILGAISLDLFAVLFGSVTALLPIFAKDVLGVGPDGLGVLRSSIALGAVITGVVLARLPAHRHPHAGAAMFGGVVLFGAAIVAFGLSESFVLSAAALFAMGAGDMLSVFVRSTVVQLGTPDEMRGRVSAVHMLFVGASNELGDFRAGLAAAWLGAMKAVVLGGVCTLAVVALWAWLFPGLRRLDRLTEVRAASPPR